MRDNLVYGCDDAPPDSALRERVDMLEVHELGKGGDGDVLDGRDLRRVSAQACRAASSRIPSPTNSRPLARLSARTQRVMPKPR